ncbi:MAG TPA: L-threonylcarbamoyladenylate synthase [Steroidobacteraceae bacterium]|nr:L-threonylcarbamoyladenylate synthase [Steroidobacteraceae bacterium]
MATATQEEIDAAVATLRAGGLVAFPTETVYGLGANAADRDAVAKIFALKGRPTDHPVIVHIDDASRLSRWVREVPEAARALAARFWPGPLTLILPKSADVDDVVTGGQDSVGIRVPSHPVAQRLLRAFGGGIAAPSANRYGRLSPTRAAHVREEFGDAAPIVLDGGEAPIGLESTIVACLGDEVRLLRPGHITRSQLVAVAGPLTENGAAPRAPGDRSRHYAPQTPIEIVPSAELEARVAALSGRGSTVGVLAMRPPPAAGAATASWIDAGGEAQAYARHLYENLRALDRAGCARILAQAPPREEPWSAVDDRLRRACGLGGRPFEPGAD